MCYEGLEGETPENHGALKVVCQYLSSYQRVLTHTVVADAHTVIVCIAKAGGGTLINMGALKLFSSGPPGTLKVVC